MVSIKKTSITASETLVVSSTQLNEVRSIADDAVKALESGSASAQSGSAKMVLALYKTLSAIDDDTLLPIAQAIEQFIFGVDKTQQNARLTTILTFLVPSYEELKASNVTALNALKQSIRQGAVMALSLSKTKRELNNFIEPFIETNKKRGKSYLVVDMRAFVDQKTVDKTLSKEWDARAFQIDGSKDATLKLFYNNSLKNLDKMAKRKAQTKTGVTLNAITASQSLDIAASYLSGKTEKQVTGKDVENAKDLLVTLIGIYGVDNKGNLDLNKIAAIYNEDAAEEEVAA